MLRRMAGTALVVLTTAALVAGCGGSSSDSTTATTAANERLTSEQWSAYETARTKLATTTTTTSATFKKCSAVAQQGEAAQFEACVGTAFSDLATAAGDARTTLESFNGTVSGPCADALANLLNYVGTYQAAAVGMQKVVDAVSLDSYPAASQDLATAFSAGKNEAKTFDQDCAPA